MLAHDPRMYLTSAPLIPASFTWLSVGRVVVQRAANKRPSLDRRSGDADARTDVDAALDGLNTVPLLSSLPQVHSLCRHPGQPRTAVMSRRLAVVMGGHHIAANESQTCLQPSGPKL